MVSRRKTIGIFTVKRSDVKPWDHKSIQSGIAGSEEAVIYISDHLVKLGYDVIIFGDPPVNSLHKSYTSNPRYVDVNFDDFPRLDIAISWRMYALAQDLKKVANKVFLWPHDICSHRLSEQEIKAFDGVLWLSEWQKNNWTQINPGFKKFKTVFGNGINPDQFQDIEERKNPYSCIYASNYARGLDLLLSIWPEVKKNFPKATLDIFYGWEGFGILSEDKSNGLKQGIKNLAHLDVSENGKIGHEQLNQAYSKASFWTYPCTNVEVFCISALRAQYAGTVPVIIRGSALLETVRHGYGAIHKDHYLSTLISAMQQAETIDSSQRSKMREFIAREYTWNIIAQKWKQLFEGLL
jgi:glycosyltransferase involved in cell wall biosynthesis